ncbi:Uncharacterised protein [Leclercia adecarboxylata]|uniref:Uncharacterized protein n=1 Tax=Leclercia adecarboxylata TaxID=83655 RepID=A0A4U9HJN2_9ENTR|nr:Uncharacterised protein [Leclercia adecarboxylata]
MPVLWQRHSRLISILVNDPALRGFFTPIRFIFCNSCHLCCVNYNKDDCINIRGNAMSREQMTVALDRQQMQAIREMQEQQRKSSPVGLAQPLTPLPARWSPKGLSLLSGVSDGATSKTG